MSVENSRVPPDPATEPMAIEPPPREQSEQELFVMARAPVGASGMVQEPGRVTPAWRFALLHPPAEMTLARMVCAGPSWS